jgi:hypothetical protein
MATNGANHNSGILETQLPSMITPSRFTLILVTSISAILALARATGIFHILASSGYVGPGLPPSVSEFYALVAIGGLLTAIVIVLVFSAASHYARKQ